jgi:hypothetical protein
MGGVAARPADAAVLGAGIFGIVGPRGFVVFFAAVFLFAHALILFRRPPRFIFFSLEARFATFLAVFLVFLALFFVLFAFLVMAAPMI